MGKKGVFTLLTRMILVNSFKWETRCLYLETIFTAEQRTDRELCHIVWRQSSKAQYQQNQWVWASDELTTLKEVTETVLSEISHIFPILRSYLSRASNDRGYCADCEASWGKNVNCDLGGYINDDDFTLLSFIVFALLHVFWCKFIEGTKKNIQIHCLCSYDWPTEPSIYW